MGRKGQTLGAPPGFRDSSQPALAVGDVVMSTYQVREHLARTETGDVFMAWDLLLQRAVVIKAAWRDAGAPPLLPEARWCSRVQDPCAIGIFHLGVHQGINVVIGERVECRVLGEWLAHKGRLEGAEVLSTFYTLARAASAAHDAGIAVGVFNIETVGIGAQGRIVLGKFALSQVLAQSPTAVAVSECDAPEVLRGDCAADDPEHAAAIDLYHLGCLGYFLATGHEPFAHRSQSDRSSRAGGHLSETAPAIAQARADLPREFSDLIVELLRKQPAARPASAAVVCEQAETIAARGWALRRRPRIMVVDDQPERAQLTADCVRRVHPWAVVLTTAGPETVVRMLRERPELVILEAPLAGALTSLELAMQIHTTVLDPPRVAVVSTRFDAGDRTVWEQLGVSPQLERNSTLVESIAALVRELVERDNSRRPITVSG